MASEKEKNMLRTIKQQEQQIKEMEEKMESLESDNFHLSSTIYAMSNDPYGDDERKNLMIRQMEQENYELSMMLSEERKLYSQQNKSTMKVPNTEIPFEKDLYIYGEDENSIQQSSRIQKKNKKRDHTNEASTSRRN